ncbi:MAG TPA: hypothetical protein VGL98_09405, partial [Gammaproteobacteria bacterium]
YDTTAFGIALGLSGALVLPVLALGVLVTVIGGSFMIADPSAVEIGQVAFALLAIGGALGFVGYLRAHFGIKDPCRHNVTATLLFLTAGVLAALSVAGVVLVTTLGMAMEIWHRDFHDGTFLLVLGALFATANLIWAFAGIGRMQRLMRRYAERAGRAFDGLPVVLLFMAIALAIAAALKTITL